ncbi:MAG: DUF1929 domain-containing protein [Chloroflexi bacterium]|nr:DUF1929 domain-containing protein [Chloroflexota bacterium]
MLAPAQAGKIMHAGGSAGAADGDPGTAAAQIIDLTVADPAWRDIAPMANPRWFLNTVLLPPPPRRRGPLKCLVHPALRGNPLLQHGPARLVALEFGPGDPNGFQITAPADANLAPPGYYMLFVLDGAGVPAVAPIIQLVAV